MTDAHGAHDAHDEHDEYEESLKIADAIRADLAGSPAEQRVVYDQSEVSALLRVIEMVERSLGEARKGLAALQAASPDMLPCGHPRGCLMDDQCNLPEHRYCGWCSAQDDAKENAASLGALLDRAETAERERDRIASETWREATKIIEEAQAEDGIWLKDANDLGRIFRARADELRKETKP